MFDYYDTLITKHNGQSSFDGLLYCCRMSNHTRYRERATTCVIALRLCLMRFPSMPFSTVLKKSALKFCFYWELRLLLSSFFLKVSKSSYNKSAHIFSKSSPSV